MRYKICILCLLSLLSASAIGQKLVFNNITVNLPSNAVSIKRHEIATRTASISKIDSDIDSKMANLYTINDQVVGLWNNGSYPGDEHPLERVKSEMTSVLTTYGKATIYSSNIKEIRSNRFVIINYEREGNYYIRFYSEDVKNNSLSGVIQYKKSEGKKAMDTLERILEGVSFK